MTFIKKYLQADVHNGSTGLRMLKSRGMCRGDFGKSTGIVSR